jgi:hypothetical protein
MLYVLRRITDNVKVGEVISDKPPVKGDIVKTVWRVVDDAWQADTLTNRVSSGDILVEPVDPELKS